MRLNTIPKPKFLAFCLKFENIVLYSLYSLSILIPLVIGKPQLFVGSSINFLITYSTLKYGIKKSLPLLILPSITATATGVLFNGATIFLVYVMPFIMVSNFLLSYFVSKKTIPSYILAILLKGLFLVIAYTLMNRVIGLPSIFVSSVYLQFVTALIGVVTAISLFKALEEVE